MGSTPPRRSKTGGDWGRCAAGPACESALTTALARSGRTPPGRSATARTARTSSWTAAGVRNRRSGGTTHSAAMRSGPFVQAGPNSYPLVDERPQMTSLLRLLSRQKRPLVPRLSTPPEVQTLHAANALQKLPPTLLVGSRARPILPTSDHAMSHSLHPLLLEDGVALRLRKHEGVHGVGVLRVVRLVSEGLGEQRVW